MDQVEQYWQHAKKLLGHEVTQWFLTAPEVRYVLLALLLVFAVGYLALLYNNLVRLSRNIERAWSNIEVLLKQRHDELRKLVEVCRHYMEYEQETLVAIIEARGEAYKARTADDLSVVGVAEAKVTDSTHRLFALAEAYPDLKSNASFQDLEQRLSELEIAIADRREHYNETVTYYNTRIQSIPDNLIAVVTGYKTQDMIMVPHVDTLDVDMSNLKRG